jgi:hypothetical protein
MCLTLKIHNIVDNLHNIQKKLQQLHSIHICLQSHIYPTFDLIYLN